MAYDNMQCRAAGDSGTKSNLADVGNIMLLLFADTMKL
jgi:hypothetical protein